MTNQVGEVFLDVHASSGSLNTEVKIAAERASHAATIEVETHVDSDSISTAVRSVARDAKGRFLKAGEDAGEALAAGVKKGVDARSIRSLAELQFSLAKVVLVAGTAGLSFIHYGDLAKGAAAATVAFTSALAESALAAVSVAGVVGGLGVALATVKIGLVGVPDAIKAVTAANTEWATTGKVTVETLQKQKAALDNLAPSARNFVTALGAAQQPFDDFRTAIQGQLFRGLGDDLTHLSTDVLPALTDEFVNIAKVLNTAAHGVADFLTSAEGSSQVQRILDGLRQTLADLLPGLGHIARGLLDLFEGLLPSSDRLAKNITQVGKAFENWAQGVSASGQLDATMKHAQETAGALLGILGNLGKSLLSVFGAGAEAGQGMFQTLDELTGRMAAFLASTEGQHALQDFFASIHDGAISLHLAVATLAPVVSQLVDTLGELGPPMHDLTDALQPLAEAVGQTLASALKAVTPLLKVVVESLTAFLNIPGMTTIAITIGAIVLALKGMAAISGTLAPKIESAKSSLTGLTTTVRDMPAVMDKAKGAIAGLAGAAGLVLLQQGAAHSNDALTVLGSTATAAAAGFAAGGPWGAAIGGAVGLLGGLASAFQNSDTAAQDFSASLDLNTGAITKQSTAIAANKALEMSDDLAKAGITTEQFTQALLGQPAALQAVNDQLALASSAAQNAGDANSAAAGRFGDMGQFAGDAAISADHLVGVLGDFRSEADHAAQVTALTSRVTRDLATQQDAAAFATMSHRDALAALIAEQNKEVAGNRARIQSNLNIVNAEKALTQASKDSNDAFKEGGQAARDAKQALLDLSGTFNENIATADHATARYKEFRAEFVQTGIQMGLTRKQAQAYAQQMLDIPDSVKTTVNTPGMPQALADSKNLAAQLAALPPLTSITIQRNILTVERNVAAGRIKLNAQGGIHTTPTHVIVGDRSGPELVVPMNPRAQLAPGVESALMTLARQRAGNSGVGAAPNIVINAPTDDPAAIAFTVLDRLAVAGVL